MDITSLQMGPIASNAPTKPIAIIDLMSGMSIELMPKQDEPTPEEGLTISQQAQHPCGAVDVLCRKNARGQKECNLK
jgi:hypothetical protein